MVCFHFGRIVLLSSDALHCSSGLSFPQETGQVGQRALSWAQGTAGIKKANSKFTFPPSQGIAKEPPYLGRESPAQLDAAQLAKGGEDNSHLPVSQQRGCTSPAWGKAKKDLGASRTPRSFCTALQGGQAAGIIVR